MNELVVKHDTLIAEKFRKLGKHLQINLWRKYQIAQIVKRKGCGTITLE